MATLQLRLNKTQINKALENVKSNIRVAQVITDQVTEEVAEDAADKMWEYFVDAKYDGTKEGIEIDPKRVSYGAYTVTMTGPGVVLNSIEYGSKASAKQAHDYYFYTVKAGNEFKAGGAYVRYKVKSAYENNETGKAVPQRTLKRLIKEGKYGDKKISDLTREYTKRSSVESDDPEDVTKAGTRRKRVEWVADMSRPPEYTRIRITPRFITNHNSAITKGNPPNHVVGKTAEYVIQKLPDEYLKELKRKQK